MVLYSRLKIFAFCLVLVVFAISCYSNVSSDIEKIKIFYKYDYMFFYGDKEKDMTVERNLTGELFSREIFDIRKISREYQNRVKKYIDIMTLFINSNIDLLKKYHNAATDPSMDKEDAMIIYNQTKSLLTNNLLPNLPEAIRCMIGNYDSQYLEVAIKINVTTSATTVEPGYPDHVYWKGFLSDDPPPYIDNKGLIDDQGVIKYHEWFYESNLKIRVVKQIRDTNGKYYGEIYADYYKLDQYDNLFNKDGNPKGVKNSIQQPQTPNLLDGA